MVAALLIGVGAVLFVYSNMRPPSTRSPIAEARAEQRLLAVALESYYIDHERYPETLALLDAPRSYFDAESLRLFADDVFEDPFAQGPEKTYMYITDGTSKYILLSPGPDGDLDVDAHDYIRSSATSASVASLNYNMTRGATASYDIVRAGP